MGGLPAQKRAFDYRVTSDDPLNPQAIFSDIIIIGLPLYCTYKAQLLETLSQFQEFQLGINYWFLMVAILFLLFGVACERFRKRKAKLPSPAGLVVTSSPYLKVFIIGLYLLFIEIFIGNSIAIASDIYSQNNSGKIFAAALDLSLISFGLFLLARRSQTNEYLSRLSKLERDVIIHELSKEDISQRLQDEFLGNYVGDWIERFLQEVRDKSEAVSKLSKKAENVIAEIQEIDEKYEHERSGRAKKYTEELKSLLQSFNASIAPLIDWLSEAELQSAINKDKFIQSIVASTIKELKANDRDVRERANLAINKFEQWLNK